MTENFCCNLLSFVNTVKTSKDSPEGTPYERNGAARRKFCKELLRDTNVLFCGRGLKRFPYLRGTSRPFLIY